jgi:hypothetical protein
MRDLVQRFTADPDWLPSVSQDITDAIHAEQAFPDVLVDFGSPGRGVPGCAAAMVSRHTRDGSRGGGRSRSQAAARDLPVRLGVDQPVAA